MWRMMVVLGMVGLCVNTAAALDGSGTQEDPWRIESLADFNEFAADANYWAGYTRLETDVNLAGLTYSTAVIAPDIYNSNWHFDGTALTGVFDGNEHKIMGLTIDDGGAGNDYLGLFGKVGEDSQVRNLGIEGGSVSGDWGVGGLVGRNSGSISDCYSTGDVNGDYHNGGLVGLNSGSVSNCYSIGDVNGYEDVGGLVGINTGRISECYSTGDVNSTGNDVGGLVGTNTGRISECYSTGDVNGNVTIGGLVGENWEFVSNCYATGSVRGNSMMGGLVGWNQGGSISNCYSTGDVNGTGSEVGGLVGHNGWIRWTPRGPVDYFGYISDSYSTGSVQGDSLVGGLVGYNEIGYTERSFWDVETSGQLVSDGGTGKTTAEMQIKSTFTDAGWDFVEIWLINQWATYPVLRQEIRSDLNGDGGVDFADFAIFAYHWLEGTGY